MQSEAKTWIVNTPSFETKRTQALAPLHLIRSLLTGRGSGTPTEGRGRGAGKGFGGAGGRGGTEKRVREGADQDPFAQSFRERSSGMLSWNATRSR